MERTLAGSKRTPLRKGKSAETAAARAQLTRPGGCLIRIRTALAALKPAERAIADFVLAVPERVISMSVSELARDVSVGDSTVIRFCRALGYEGYQDFKVRLAQDLVEPAAYIHEDVKFGDAISDVAQKIFQNAERAVSDTRQAMDTKSMDAAVKAVAGARQVHFYGSAYSFFAALDAKYKLMRLGVATDAFGDGHLQAMAAATLGKGDVAVGLSHSGASRDSVESLIIARRKGATTIAITNYHPSPITGVADIVLLTASRETPLGGEVLTSRIAQLCVIDVLSTAVAIHLGEDCLESIRSSFEAVRNKLI